MNHAEEYVSADGTHTNSIENRLVFNALCIHLNGMLSVMILAGSV